MHEGYALPLFYGERESRDSFSVAIFHKTGFFIIKNLMIEVKDFSFSP